MLFLLARVSCHCYSILCLFISTWSLFSVDIHMKVCWCLTLSSSTSIKQWFYCHLSYVHIYTVINTYTHGHIAQIDQIYLLFQALTLWTFSMKTRESGNEARLDSFILSPSLQPFRCLCTHLHNIPCTAQQFFARHSQRQETFYEEEQLRLKSITTPQQMLHNDLVNNFR